jgi:translocation and assembly module TamB
VITRRMLVKVLGGAFGCLCLLALVTAWYLHTQAFRNWALAEVIRVAEERTGMHVRVQGLELSFTPFLAEFRGITVNGARRDGERPVFQAEQIQIGLRIWPLLRRRVRIDRLVLERPRVFVWTDAQGRSNVNPFPAQNSPDSSFRLAVRYVAIHNGMVTYGDETVPLTAEVYELESEVNSELISGLYRGHVNYDRGRITVKDFRTIEHGLSVKFTANEKHCSLEDWQVKWQDSEMRGRGEITGYTNPAVSGDYQANIRGENVGFILKSSTIPAGMVLLHGSLRYEKPNETAGFLDSVQASGDFSSGLLSVRAGQNVVDAKQLQGKYSLRLGKLQIENVDAQVLGGRFRSVSNVIDLHNNSGTLRAELRKVQLSEVGYSISADQRKIRLASAADADLALQWNGGFSILQAHVKAKLQSAEASGRDPKAIPADGALDFTYDAAHDRLLFADSVLTVGVTQLHLSGEMSKNSSLNVRLNTEDVNSLILLVSTIETSDALQKPVVRNLQGEAKFDGHVAGKLARPDINGHLTANDFVVGETKWSSVQADLRLNPQLLKVSNAVLANAQGQIQMSGELPLDDWGLNRSGTLLANAQVHTLSAATLQKAANSSYPIEGILSGNVRLSGSIDRLDGNGHIDLAKATVYGEPLTTVRADFTTKNQQFMLNGEAQSAAGALTASLSYDPRSRTYDTEGKTENLDLGQIKSLRSKFQDLTGKLNANFAGKGTLDDPELDVHVQSPSLQMRGETAKELNAQLSLRSHRGEITLSSRVEGADVHANGHIELRQNYDSEITLETGEVPIGPLLQRFLPSQGASAASGQFEVHAHVKGPLKHPEQLEGQANIEKLHVLAKTFDFSSTSPLQLELHSGVLQIKNGELKGSGTDVVFGGSVQLQEHGQLQVSTHGALDLKSVASFFPGASSSGQVTMQLEARGTRQSPQIEGQINIANAAFSSDEMPMGIESTNGTISLRGKHLEIQKLSGIAGGGQVTVSGSADLSATTTYGLVLRTTSTRVRQEGVRSVIDADLALNGNTDKSVLSGRVTVHKLSFNPSSDLNEIIQAFSSDETLSESSPFKEKIKLNVAVQSDEQLAANSSQLSIAGTANLNIAGNLANPIILGRISLTSGEVFFLGKRFEIQDGTVVFANAVRTSPVVNLHVNTTVEQYNITINLSGTTDKLNTSYTSDPSLPTADIINLLAFGQTTTEAASNANTPASLGAESAVASTVGSQVAGQLQGLTGLSQLTIDPGIGGSSSQNPGTQIAVQQRVTGNLLVTFSTDLTSAQSQAVQVKYQAKRNVTISILRDQNGGYGIDVHYHKAF